MTFSKDKPPTTFTGGTKTNSETQYTVCLLFSSDKKKILLQKKAKTVFAGKLNGVGGKVEPGETPKEGALREIREETSVTDVDLTWLGTLSIPIDCVKQELSVCTLHFYGGMVENLEEIREPEGAEKLFILDVEDVQNKKYELAGNGDVAYFIDMAVQ